jgi:hypothetical protein
MSSLTAQIFHLTGKYAHKKRLIFGVETNYKRDGLDIALVFTKTIFRLWDLFDLFEIYELAPISG